MDKLCSPVETELIEYSMSLGFEDLTEKEQELLATKIKQGVEVSADELEEELINQSFTHLSERLGAGAITV